MRTALIALIALTSFALPAHAQISTYANTFNDISVSASPQYPSPGDTVTLRVTSAGIDLENSTVRWSVNGEPAGEGAGLRSISAVAGGLGSVLSVSVSASGSSGSGSGSLSLRPVKLTVLWEANTFTPPFYRGRALPSAGSLIIAEAVPHFVRSGREVPAAELTYTWRKNGEVMFDISGRGRSSVTFSAPTLFSRDVITVDARTDDSVLVGREEFMIRSREPLLELYQNHPLYGIFFNRAVSDGEVFADTEVSLVAMPYFANADSVADARMVYSWQVDQKPIAGDASAPGAITIAGEDGVSGLVELSVANTKNILETIRRQWTISFNADARTVGGFGGPNPFMAQ